jgi:hypothetical protein
MNCTQCQKPVDEHGESRETDWCIALREGLVYPTKEGRWTRQKDNSHLAGYTKEHILGFTDWLPHYSFPTMSAETWELTKKLGYDWSLYPQEDLFVLFLGIDDINPVIFNAPTPTLTICRAFLAKEEE